MTLVSIHPSFALVPPQFKSLPASGRGSRASRYRCVATGAEGTRLHAAPSPAPSGNSGPTSSGRFTTAQTGSGFAQRLRWEQPRLPERLGWGLALEEGTRCPSATQVWVMEHQNRGCAGRRVVPVSVQRSGAARGARAAAQGDTGTSSSRLA